MNIFTDPVNSLLLTFYGVLLYEHSQSVKYELM